MSMSMPMPMRGSVPCEPTNGSHLNTQHNLDELTKQRNVLPNVSLTPQYRNEYQITAAAVGVGFVVSVVVI